MSEWCHEIWAYGVNGDLGVCVLFIFDIVGIFEWRYDITYRCTLSKGDDTTRFACTAKSRALRLCVGFFIPRP